MASRKGATCVSTLWAWLFTCFLNAFSVVLEHQAAQMKMVYSTPKHITRTLVGSVPGGEAAICPGFVLGAAVGPWWAAARGPFHASPIVLPRGSGLSLPCRAVKNTRWLSAIAFVCLFL